MAVLFEEQAFNTSSLLMFFKNAVSESTYFTSYSFMRVHVRNNF